MLSGWLYRKKSKQKEVKIEPEAFNPQSNNKDKKDPFIESLLDTFKPTDVTDKNIENGKNGPKKPKG